MTPLAVLPCKVNKEPNPRSKRRRKELCHFILGVLYFRSCKGKLSLSFFCLNTQTERNQEFSVFSNPVCPTSQPFKKRLRYAKEKSLCLPLEYLEKLHHTSGTNIVSPFDLHVDTKRHFRGKH